MQFDNLIALSDRDDRATPLIETMESIESDYESLRDVPPKGKYRKLD
ncbi:MAG: hypothetical protein ACOC7K_01595 [bacterium]